MAKAKRNRVSAETCAGSMHLPFVPRDYLAAALTAIVALAVYLPMVSSTVTGEDSGDFITAAYTLGIAHPPGYPLWCMLAKLFTFIPYDTIAWRVSAMSAFWGASAAAIVCLIVIRITRNRVAAVAAGLAVAFSFEFWEQAVIAEVYSLNAFFIVLCILILFVWQETRKDKLLYVFAAVYGLGVSNHATVALLGPVYAAFILSFDRRPWQRWKMYLSLPLIALGCWTLVHLYLPIRAAADPFLNWGDPVTWDRFWDLVLRRQYPQSGVSDTPRTLERFVREFGLLLPRYAVQYTVWLAAVPLLGLYPLWKHDRRRAALIVGIFVYINVCFALYLNTEFDDNTLWIITTFFIPAHIMAGIVMGVGAHWVSGLKLAKTRLVAVGWALLVAMPLLPLMQHYRANDRSNDFYAYDYGMNILNTMEPNALYFASSDESVFPVLYLLGVEGLRPDITFANETGCPDAELYADMPSEIVSAFSTPRTASEMFQITDWILAHTDRPVYCNTMITIEGFPGAKMAPDGLLYRLVRPGESEPKNNHWPDYQWQHDMDRVPDPPNMSSSNIVAEYHYAQGRDLLQKGENEKGLEQMAIAAQLAGRRTDILDNLARTCIDHGELDAAVEYHTRALDVSPMSIIALRNLALIYGHRGEYDKQISYGLRALSVEQRRLGPDSFAVAELANEVAGAYFALDDLASARRYLEHALSIDGPKSNENPVFAARDLHNLSLVFYKQGDHKTAVEYRQQALRALNQLLGQDHPWTQRAMGGRFISGDG